METIENFIKNFKKIHKAEIEDLFLNGYCYYFAIILDERYFHAGTIMFIPIYNHFCYKIYNDLYDISGIINNEEMIKLAVPWKEYEKKNNKEIENIYTDCILKSPKIIKS